MSKPDFKRFLANLSTKPGVYRMLDAGGVVLYVGKASNLKKRVSSYFLKNNSLKTKSLVSQIVSIEVSITRSETEALLLESTLIKSLRPKYNILMRDDKSYPYIHVSRNQEFPRMEFARPRKKPKTNDYFGPYPSVTAVRETLALIQKIFKIRNCSDSFFNARTRPCLQYQIKRCSAPCTAYISPEEYQQSVQDAIRFLQGKSRQILEEFEQKMERAVANLEFELAAKFRDQIKSLRLVQEMQGLVQARGEADIIVMEVRPGFACIQYVSIREGQVLQSQAFYPKVPALMFTDDSDINSLRQEVFSAFIQYFYVEEPKRIPPLILCDFMLEDKKVFEMLLTDLLGKACRIQINPRGSKAHWLDFAQNNLQKNLAEHAASAQTMAERYEALRSLLDYPKPIKRMECFDISHTQGSSTVASCVVFNQDGPSRGDYRRFNIEAVTPGDDYAAMEQVLTRRFKRLQENADLPDILLIDGGKGQVSVARKVLKNLQIEGLTLLGIAKGPGRKAGFEQLILADDKQEKSLAEDSKALHLLQYIRDEAHRFAISFHRKKRQNKALASSLESIPGIGAKRRQALLRRFGGIRELSKAAIVEIAKVQGISQSMAEKIYEHFHG